MRRTILALGLLGVTTTPTPALTFAELASDRPETVAYAAEAGDKCRLEVFFPDADRRRPRPALILIHGGAWVGGEPGIFAPHAAYFARRGLVAISVGYRLATPQAGSLATCVDDTRAALVYVRANAEKLGIDPARIAVLGDSAGGHLAAVLATDSAGGVAAAVLANPIVDLEDGDWMKFVIAGPALERQAPPEALVPSPAQRALGRALSPLHAVRPGLPPTLLLHGTADRVVRPEQSQRFQAAMVQAGNSCDLRLLEGARHAFLVPRYTAPESLVVETVRTIDAFLASQGFLSGPPTLQPSDPPLWQPR